MTAGTRATPVPGAGLAQGPVEWGLLLTLVILWGSAFVLIRVSLDAFTPIAVATGRLVVGAAVLLAILGVLRQAPPRQAAAWRFFAWMALIGNALPFYLISWGQQGVPSGLAGILMAMMPLGVLVMAHFFVPGERLTRRRVSGFALGFVGVVVLIGPEALRALGGNGGQLVSQLAVLAGALCYGVAAILARRGPTFDPIVSAACVLTLAALMAGASGAATALPALGMAGFVHGEITYPAAVALLCLGAMSTALATVVFFNLVRRAGPTFLSLINYLIPVWAVLLGAVALGERLPPRAFAALALILGGILVARFRERAGEDAP